MAAGGRPLTLGCAGGAVGSVQGLSRRVETLSFSLSDSQHEVMQGAAKDGVGAVVKRLERRYVAVPPQKHRQCVGKVIRQLRRRLAGGGGVVSSGGMFGSTQCLRKLLKKNE
jgi:hypothetical protein